MTNIRPSLPEPGWLAELKLEFRQQSDKTVLAGRKQRGPLAIQRPFYPEGDACHAYVLHPPGGVVGGDQIVIDATAENKASCLLTTPGATKFYRSEQALASQRQHFTVEDGASLEWLPQENIFFPRANCSLQTDIHLQGNGRFIGWEINCLGRPAIGESFEPGLLDFATRLFRQQQAVYLDRLRVRNENELHGAAGLRGEPVIATLIATPASGDALDISQTCCEKKLTHGTAGATLLNDVLLVRYLGGNTAEAHQLLRNIWMQIRPLINGREAVAPRIWAT